MIKEESVGTTGLAGFHLRKLVFDIIEESIVTF